MLRLIQWMFFGHVHKWKTIADNPLRVDDGERQVAFGHRYTQQCVAVRDRQKAGFDMSYPNKTSASDARELLPCPWCNGSMMFRKALHVSDGNVDAIIHRDPGNCPMPFFEDGTTDESIIEKWNTRASPAPQGGEPDDVAQGYADSLRQQAKWIEESREGSVPVSDRIDLGDIDTDELRAAADFIEKHVSGRCSPAATADARKALSNAIDSLTVQELSEVFGGNRKTPLSRSYSEQIVDIIAPKLEAALTDKRPPMQEDGK